MDIDELVMSLDENFRLELPSREMPFLKDSKEAIFNLPLLTAIILVVSSNKKIQFAVEDISYWITRVLFEMYSNFVFSEQRLRLSSALKKRSVDAILFLESSEFISVEDLNGRRVIALTERGKKFINKYRQSEGDISRILGRVDSAVGRISIKGDTLI